MSRLVYWLEALECSLDESGCYHVLTPEQRQSIAEDLLRAAEMEAESCGWLNIPDPRVEEMAKLKTQLKTEQEKVVCRACNGRKYITTYGGTFQSTSSCQECRGEGKVNP